MRSVAPAELAKQLGSSDALRLLDVREADEHAFCALPDSRLLPLSELGDRADELDNWRNNDVVVYCHHGVRSAHAIAYLESLGFTKLSNLTGGIDRWSAEVDPNLPRY